MKKAISLLTALFILSCMAFPAFAAEQAQTEKTVLPFEDGSYLVVTLEVDSLARATTPVATKTYMYYNSEDERQWDYTLRAVFTYDGISADAISAEARAAIYNREWSLTESDPHCQGAYAIADATFESSSDGSRSITVRLYCDGHGNIT